MRCSKKVLASVRASVAVALAAGLLLTVLGGCKSFLDQAEVTRGPNSDRLVVPILDSIDPVDEAKTEFAGAADVTAEDLKPVNEDYVISRGDLITVSVFDLVNMGVESVRSARVSETGKLSLPMLPDPVVAAGLKEADLQKAIAAKYKEAGLLPNAQVAVTVVEAIGRTFNITGSVSRPGLYPIREADFRMLQALTASGDVTFPVEYIYVIRKRSSEKPSDKGAGEKPVTEPVPAAPTTGPTDLAPKTEGGAVERPVMAMVAEPAKGGQGEPKEPEAGNEGRFGTVEGKTVLISPTTQGAGVVGGAGVAATQSAEAAKTQPAYEFGAGTLVDEDQRVIRVGLAALRNGDLRQNIVVRPGDMIYVPVPLTGVYYMYGHILAPGAYNFAGQKVSLMNAIAAARGLGPMAAPSRTDVVRRIGGDKQVFVRVDLYKIFEGREPDIFLKPNDMVQVGTDFYPPFLAAIRGAFRITYGFGFLYDRNYAPAQATRFATN